MSGRAPDRRAVLAGLGAALVSGRSRAAHVVPPPRSAEVRQTVVPGRTLALHLAVPGKARGRRAAVLVVHDRGGLDVPTREAADYVATLGFVGCAPDLLTKAGGTPPDAAAARIMTGTLDPAQALADLAAAARWLGRNPPGERVLTGRVAALGLGWGAGLVDRLAREDGAPIVAAVTFGGSAEDGRPFPLPMLRLAAQDAAGWASAAAFLEDHLR